jgi:hypothetical protein
MENRFIQSFPTSINRSLPSKPLEMDSSHIVSANNQSFVDIDCIDEVQMVHLLSESPPPYPNSNSTMYFHTLDTNAL